MNISREEERIASAFRAGWRGGMYYTHTPHTSDQLAADEDEALKKYLETLPKEPTRSNLGG